MTVRPAPRVGPPPYWLKLALACAFAWLAACSATPPRTRANDATPVSVVTLNLWHDRGDWPRRQSMIVDELQRLSPDVIVLQEVLQDQGLPNQAQALASRLDYHWHFVSVDPPDRARRYGNAILTRAPMTRRGSRVLQPPDDYRIAGWARIELRGRPLAIYAVHLNFSDASGATRARQIAGVLDLVAATRGEADVVIGGDFNARADGPEFAPLRASYADSYATTHAGDVDAPAHTTLNPAFGHAPQRIDHVFAQADAFVPLESRRLFLQPADDGTWASDHFGLWVRLQRR